MNTDKNTVIGFILLAGLFFTYFWYTNKQQNELQTYKKHYDDSVAMVKSAADKAAALKAAAIIDSAAKNNPTDSTKAVDSVKEQLVVLENNFDGAEIR